jgi:hypothetical protein
MANLNGIMQQLKKERNRVERELSGLNAALAAFVNVYAGRAKQTHTRRKLSAKAKMSAAQKARWAKANGQAQKSKRTMSAAARRKIAAAQRARWAKMKRQQKKAT